MLSDRVIHYQSCLKELIARARAKKEKRSGTHEMGKNKEEVITKTRKNIMKHLTINYLLYFLSQF